MTVPRMCRAVGSARCQGLLDRVMAFQTTWAKEVDPKMDTIWAAAAKNLQGPAICCLAGFFGDAWLESRLTSL